MELCPAIRRRRLRGIAFCAGILAGALSWAGSPTDPGRAQAAPDATDGGTEFHRREILEPAAPGEDGAVRVAFIDADSTIRVTRSGATVPQSPDDFILLPGVAEKIAQLKAQGYFVAIVSNQVKVPLLRSLRLTENSFSELENELRARGAGVNYFDFATGPDHTEKPSTGMADILERKLVSAYGPRAHIDREHSLMIGDSGYTKDDTRPDGRPGGDSADFDRLFAENLGIPYLEPDRAFGWDRYGVHRINSIQEMSVYAAARCMVDALASQSSGRQ